MINRNFYYKIGLVGLLLSQCVHANDVNLKNGLNLIGNCEAQSIAKTDFVTRIGSSYVNTIAAENNGKRSDGSTGFAITFPSIINIGQGYLVEVNADTILTLNCSDYTAYYNYKVGMNLLTIPNSINTKSSLSSSLSSVGINLSNVIAAENNGKRSDGSTGFAITFPTNLISGYAYLIDIASIDYDTYITNALTSDADLTSFSTEDLNDKSLVVMENNSGALKTSLITFNNGDTYKEVILSSFTPSTLNSSDTDINSTITSQVSSITTGICGNWNWNGADLTMTPVDDSNVSQTSYQAVIADSSDGNFTTVVGSTSTYKKVVWYGDAISLSGVSDCTVDGLPTGTSPSTDGISPPQMPGL